MIHLARPLSVTFHRAFDLTKNPYQSLGDLIELGVDRLLTSGQERSAIEGRELIKELIKTTGNRIIILPGAGLNEDNIEDYAQFTKAKEFHCAGRSLAKVTKVIFQAFPIAYFWALNIKE